MALNLILYRLPHLLIHTRNKGERRDIVSSSANIASAKEANRQALAQDRRKKEA